MAPKVTVPCKALGAEWAREGLFPCVSADVVTESSFLNKSRGTVWAGKGLLACVGANVHDQVVFPWRVVSTVGALVELAAGYDASLGSCGSLITLLTLLSCL